MYAVSRLGVAENLSGTDALVLADVVQSAEFVNAQATLAGDGIDGLAFGHLVIEVVAGLGTVILVGGTSLRLATCGAVHLLVRIGVLLATGGQVGLSTLTVVLAGTEKVEVARDILIAEVEHQCGVERHATEACLEVEVRTRGTTSVSTETDGVTSPHVLIFPHKVSGQVAVDGLQSVVVTDDNIVAVTCTFVTHYTNLAVEGSANRISLLHLDVETLVHAAPASSKLAGNHAALGWHVEAPKIDAEGVGNIRFTMCILVAPFVV